MKNRRLTPPESAEEWERRAEEYFDECDETGQPKLLTGLILALGLKGRESFREYGEKEGYGDIVNWALTVVASGYEAGLWNKALTGSSMTFALKSLGWEEKDEEEQGITEAIYEALGKLNEGK